jgi:hypothetical protein
MTQIPEPEGSPALIALAHAAGFEESGIWILQICNPSLLFQIVSHFHRLIFQP